MAFGISKSSDGTTVWVSFTPVITWTGGVGTITGFWRRTGSDTIEVQFRIPVTGGITPTTTTLEIGLPSGFTPDESKIIGSGSDQVPLTGSLRVDDIGTGNYTGTLTYNYTAGAVVPRAQTSATADTGLQDALPFTFANTDIVSGSFQIPVNE